MTRANSMGVASAGGPPTPRTHALWPVSANWRESCSRSVWPWSTVRDCTTGAIATSLTIGGRITW